MKNDLVERLEIRAEKIEAGKRIAWDSDVALMREAAARIEELEDVEIDLRRLREVREPGGCQCSDDDACKFARDRDMYMAALQAIYDNAGLRREVDARIGPDLLNVLFA